MEQELIETVKIEYSVEKEIQSMIDLFSIQSYSRAEAPMIKYIKSQLKGIKKLQYKQDNYGNILVTKGVLYDNEFYPCVVAHMDTVHNFVENYHIKKEIKDNGTTKLYAAGLVSKNTFGVTQFEPVNTQKKVLGNTGIGGDDKCGIWLALKLLKELPKLKIVFTVEEEIGAIGASKVDTAFFNDVGYLIEGDRKDNCDIITDIYGSSICSQEFLDTIFEPLVKYNYTENSGMLTDILAIKENNIELSAINVSVGYYNPHSSNEYIIVEDLLKATSFVKECIKELGYSKYEHVLYNDFKNTGVYSKYFNWYDFDDYDEQFGYTKHCTCSKHYKNEGALIDLNCDVHNEILCKNSGFICSCGEELEARELSYNCPFCNKIYSI